MADQVYLSTVWVNTDAARLTSGDVVLRDTAVDNGVKRTSTPNSTGLAGVVLVDADPGHQVAVASVVGERALVKVFNGDAIARGDKLVTSNSPGYAKVDNGADLSAVVAIATEAKAGGAGTLVEALIVANAGAGAGGGGYTPPVVHPFYALDYDGGNDANLGFSDTSMADAGTKAKKTWEGLLAIMATDGAAKVIDIGIKGRASGATYLKVDGVTKAPLDLRPLQNYAAIRVHGTSDFTLNTEDLKRRHPIIAPGCTGPNGDGSFTITAVSSNKITIGGGGLPTDVTGRGYRLRVYSPGAPATTKYVRGIKRINGNDIYVMAFSVAGVANGDVCVIERPSVAFSQILWWGGADGIRADDGLGELYINGSVLVINGIRATGEGANDATRSSSFIGGDVYMEFVDIAYQTVTRVSYLEAFPANAGMGLRTTDDVGLGASFMELTACAILGDAYLFGDIIEVEYGILQADLWGFQGDENVSGSWLQETRLLAPNTLLGGGGWFDVDRPELWEGTDIELHGHGSVFTISSPTGQGGGNDLLVTVECSGSLIDFSSTTVPPGYSALVSFPFYGGRIMDQAHFDMVANTLWGLRDSRGNMLAMAGSQVSESHEHANGSTIEPYLACRMSGANVVTPALADSATNARVVGVSVLRGVTDGGVAQGLMVVKRGIAPIDMTDGLGLGYTVGAAVYLSDAVAGKGTVTPPAIKTFIGTIVSGTGVANRVYVDVNIKTSD